MYEMLSCHDVMIKAHHKYSQKANMVKEHKSHKRALRFQAGKELRYYRALKKLILKLCEL